MLASVLQAASFRDFVGPANAAVASANEAVGISRHKLRHCTQSFGTLLTRRSLVAFVPPASQQLGSAAVIAAARTAAQDGYNAPPRRRHRAKHNRG